MNDGLLGMANAPVRNVGISRTLTFNWSYGYTFYWLCPKGVESVIVEIFGSGGGGGGGYASFAYGGGGGGGGYLYRQVRVNPGTTYTVICGASGAAGSNGAGGTGGVSSFGYGQMSDYPYVTGGVGGGHGQVATWAGGAGGIAYNGDVMQNGTQGESGGVGNETYPGTGKGGYNPYIGIQAPFYLELICSVGGNGGLKTPGTSGAVAAAAGEKGRMLLHFLIPT